MQLQNTIPLDPQVVALSKAIIQTESGGNPMAQGKSGEYGMAQWMPNTWKAQAKDILGDPNAPMTEANQKAVIYSVIAKDKANGLNPASVAAKWNIGSPTDWENKIGTNSSTGVAYNVPQYVKSVTDAYQTIKAGGNVGVDPNNPSSTAAPQIPQDTSGALFPSSPTDNPLMAALKTAGNLPGSLFNFAKGVVSSLNPLNTLKTIEDIGSGLSNTPQGMGQAILDTITGLPAAAFHTLVPQGVQQALTGDFAGAAKNFTNDPFGQTAPIVLAALGSAKLADTAGGGLAKAASDSRAAFTDTGVHVMPQQGVYSSALDTGISKVGGLGSDIINKVAGVPIGWAGGIVKSAASHLIGLEPTDLSTILKNPEAFSKIAQDQTSRGGLANEFGTALDTLESHMQDTGTGYKAIRLTQTLVAVPENFIPDVLNKYGLKTEPQLDAQNNPLPPKVISNTTSITRNLGDIKAIQNFVDNWGNKTTLTPEEYLNMRSDLGDLSRFDLTSGKTKASDTVGKALYAEANRTIRPQIQGLKSLDETYAPVKTQFDQLKKDFLQKQGNEYVFKDGAINKIANASGVGKDALLARMEQILPGITKKIQILKTVENIQKAYGNKVGNYSKAILEGGGFLTGNIPAILAGIISNPAIAVPLLRGAGLGWAKVAPIVGALKIIAGDVNSIPKITQTSNKND